MKHCLVCGGVLTESNWQEYAKENWINKCATCLREEKRQAASAFAASTSGFLIAGTAVAADTISGTVVLTRLSGNTWNSLGIAYRASGTTAAVGYSAGAKTLSGTLTQLRLGTVAGDTLDAGSVSILYD